jgi:hypothetical protein
MTNALFKKRQSRTRHRPHHPRHASAPVDLPLGQAHLCPGDRRRPGRDHCRGLDQREGRQGSQVWNVNAASSVGKKIAERSIAKGVKQVMFDRGGYIYHGRIKALADAARDSGLEF